MSTRRGATLIICLGLTGTSSPAEPVELRQGAWAYTIDGEVGNVLGARQGEEIFLEPAFDHYRLLTAGQEQTADESADRVVETDAPEGKSRLTLLCENEPLGLRLRKTYWIEQETGWLFKSVVVSAREGVAGQLWFESGATVPADWWRNGVIWQPVMHTGSLPYYRTSEFKEETNLAPRNGCRSVVMLYQPGKDKTLAHWRWGGEAFEVFMVIGEHPNYGKRVWPRKWLLGSQLQFVGEDEPQTVTIKMVYGVQEGSAQDFLLAYAARDEYPASWCSIRCRTRPDGPGIRTSTNTGTPVT